MIDEKILKLCMRVNGLTAFFPQFNELDNTPLEPTPDMVGKYGWNNGVVAFVTPKGDYYATPYCVEVADYLSSHGYTNSYIYVPFSNGDEPSDGIKAQEWKKLRVGAKELHNQKEKERRREQIKQIAKNKGIKDLPEVAYELSLEIPDEGLSVKHYGSEVTISRPVADFNLKSNLGTYCQNNSRVVFVNEKGKTYVTPYCHEIIRILESCGYTKGSLFVPLSNGEDITTPELKNRWQILCSGARQRTNERLAEERKQRLIVIAKNKGIGSIPTEAYRLAFEIPSEGVDTIWFGDKHETTMPINEWELEHAVGTYCQNNGRVVFVDDKGKTYVTPFASEFIATLRKLGYKERSMYVPFSNGDIPSNVVFALKWKQLCSIARKELEEREEKRRENKIRELAKKRRIRKLPDAVYELSLRIPKEGFETIFLETEKDRVRPVQEWELEHALGTYCQNNGRLVFVDESGNTYVTPYCSEVAGELEMAGYVPSSLFVPLSNGEKIVDPLINSRWDQLCSRLSVGSGRKL